jgi:hypothetical protein
MYSSEPFAKLCQRDERIIMTAEQLIAGHILSYSLPAQKGNAQRVKGRVGFGRLENDPCQRAVPEHVPCHYWKGC